MPHAVDPQQPQFGPLPDYHGLHLCRGGKREGEALRAEIRRAAADRLDRGLRQRILTIFLTNLQLSPAIQHVPAGRTCGEDKHGIVVAGLKFHGSRSRNQLAYAVIAARPVQRRQRDVGQQAARTGEGHAGGVTPSRIQDDMVGRRIGAALQDDVLAIEEYQAEGSRFQPVTEAQALIVQMLEFREYQIWLVAPGS